MRHQEQPPVQGLWSPHSAMEVMNQSGQPWKSGKGRPMWPAPLTSGGLALEEVTCRGWGPHLQYSFLIKLASLSGKYLSFLISFFFFFEDVEKKVGPKSPNSTPLGSSAHTKPPLTKIWESRYFKPQPHPTMWLRQGPGCRRPSNP